MHSKFNPKLIKGGTFTLLFLILSLFYGYHNTLFYAPQSVHIWRQTNSLSLAMNYYQDNLPFLKPEMHNHFPEGGYSGKSVGEFPVIYYLVAMLWKIFGYHIWIFKLVHLLIFYFGLLSLFLTLKKLFQNNYWAGFLSLIVFTSPMIIFYGPNFLPDVPALAFVFMAWYFMSRFLMHRKAINLWISALLFCIAMLLKVTSAISFIAVGGWIIYEMLFLKENARVFSFRLKHILPFLLILFPVIIWYLYVEHYNSQYKGHFSYHGIWPAWDITKDQFRRIIDVQDKIYFKEMFLPFTQFLTIAIWLFLLLRIKKIKPVYRYFLIVLPTGAFFQLLLWFQVLDGHDYYMINLLVVFVAVWAIFIKHLKVFIPLPAKILYGLAVLFFALNVWTAHHRHNARYTGWMNDMYNNMKALLEIEPQFRNWGISPEDKVISLPDMTINGSLVFMNRKGYTEFGSDLSNPETYYSRIEHGAKYLIINDSTILSRSYLQPFLQNKIGEYKNIRVYNLQ